MRGTITMRAKRSWLAAMPLLAIAACTAQPELAGTGTAPATPADAPAGGPLLTGASTAGMSAQYAPRAGAVPATGASAWVAPAPAPAFVASGPPPAADPPAPPPAAVANRQPDAPAADAANVVRPEAAVPDAGAAAAAPAALDPAVRTRGLALFNDYACGTCHALADAGASGAVGPSFDRNPGLTKAIAVDVISNGRGAMPAFGGQMSDAEIATLAEYIVGAGRR